MPRQKCVGFDEFVDNPELHDRTQRRKFLCQAKKLLKKQKIHPNQQTVLFKAMHACGYLLAGTGAGKQELKKSRQESLIFLKREIQDRLIRLNSGLIRSMKLHSRFVYALDENNVDSEAYWALFRAVVNFDPWRGFQFSTFGCKSIIRGLWAVSKRRMRDIQRIERLKERQLSSSKSMIVHPNTNEDLICDVMLECLAGALSTSEYDGGLDNRERLVLDRRILADEPETLEKVGENFKVGKERIRQIQERALKKLHLLLTGKNKVIKRRKCARRKWVKDELVSD